MSRLARPFAAIASLALLGACGSDDPVTPPTGLFGCEQPQSYAIGETVNGALSTTDCLDPAEIGYADYFEFSRTAQGPVSIYVRSTGVDLVVALFTRQGAVLDFEYAFGANDSALVSADLLAGNYAIIVAAQNPGETGGYVLTSTPNAPPPPPPYFGCPVQETLTAGTPFDGSLADTDCELDDARWMDRYDFEVASTRQVTISLTSSAFDSYLYLFGDAGQVLAENDDVGFGDVNSRIVLTLQPGTYSIGATSWLPREAGAYTVRID